jgi:hypothetical protein
MSTSIAPSRLTQLARLRSQIFQTAYNPTGVRTGAKYLRARLRGPSMVKYYPPEINIAQIMRKYPELELVNQKEEQRLADLAEKKRRGKGPPKKAKSKGEHFFPRFCFSLLKVLCAGESRRTHRIR